MENFLVHEAYKHHISGEGITKVVVVEETNEIIAYYTLKCDAMKIIDDEMYTEPRYIPCVEISRIAVVSSWQNGKQGIHLGTKLMQFIINFIKEKISTVVGCRFITLYALPNKEKWYREEFKFLAYEDENKDSKDNETIYMYLDITDSDKMDECINYMREEGQ